MDLLNRLGAAQRHTFGLITDLNKDEKYQIEHWTSLSTRFGRQIAVLINNIQYSLPNRFQNVTDDEIQKYNKKKIQMIFKGTKKFGHLKETPILEFVES
jgi:PHP family Zn ribbon phosphoesterase